MTKTWARRSSQAGVIAAGILLFTGGVAAANGTDAVSAGNNGLGNGNQVIAPVQAPIDLCGNAVSVIGVSGAGCTGGSAAGQESGVLGDMTSAGNNGLANGNQAQVPIQAPVDVCGNAVSVVGVSGAGCMGGSAADMSKNGGNAANTESAPITENGSDLTSVGNNGLANGNQAQAPIQVPINVCGNSVAVAGASGAGCTGGSAAGQEAGLLGDMTSAGNQGLGNGNQVQAPIQVPVNLCGNSIAVLGVAGAGCDGGSSADMSKNGGNASATEAGVGDLTSGVAPGTADLPVDGTVDQATSQLPAGDAVSGVTGGLPTDVAGSTADTATQQAPAANQQPAADQQAPVANQQPAADQQAPAEQAAPESKGTDMTSAGNNGVLNGTQIDLPVQAPIDVSGNAVGVLGVAGAGSMGGSSASSAG